MMVDPGSALAVFAALVLVTALAFWPRWGVVMRLRRMSRLSSRVMIEDALKHVLTCERRGRTGTLESVAGRLEISPKHAARILSQMVGLGLLRMQNDALVLTESGRASAVGIVRSHRLWERYLADRTGLPPGEWHDRAERMEHAISREEADVLESRLGHPRWDPHGDPIPTAAGDMPPARRATLQGVAAGRAVEILHLEDEPREIYDDLLDHGLAPGVRLEVVDRGDRSIRVRSQGREWELDSLAASNVTVRSLPEGESVDGVRPTLLDAPPGRGVIVAGISPACQGAQRRRLLDLGVVRGTEIVPELVSASGDPVAYRIRGALIALRREQASWIRIEPVEAASPGDVPSPADEAVA